MWLFIRRSWDGPNLGQHCGFCLCICLAGHGKDLLPGYIIAKIFEKIVVYKNIIV